MRILWPATCFRTFLEWQSMSSVCWESIQTVFCCQDNTCTIAEANEGYRRSIYHYNSIIRSYEPPVCLVRSLVVSYTCNKLGLAVLRYMGLLCYATFIYCITHKFLSWVTVLRLHLRVASCTVCSVAPVWCSQSSPLVLHLFNRVCPNPPVYRVADRFLP